MDAPATDVITLSELATMIFRYGVVTVVSIALVIIVHEFGHYLAARAVGVKVRKFSLGFGKELFGRTDRWGTRWCVSRLPIGGYVEIFGDVDRDNPIVWDKENNCERRLTDEELKVAFCTKKVWQRMIIVAAGPAINIFMALSLLAGLYMINGVAILPPIINCMGLGTASYDAGFKLGDRILEVDGKKIYKFDEIYEITRKDWINSHSYKVLRQGKEIMITMTAREANFTDKKGRDRSGNGRTGMLHATVSNFTEIQSINGIGTKDNADKARELLKQHFDKVIQLGLRLRENEDDIFITIVPSAVNEHLNDPKHHHYDRFFNKDIKEIEYEKYNIVRAYGKAFEEIQQGITMFVKLVSVFYKGKTDRNALGGIKVVGEYGGQAAKEGWKNVIFFIVMLSTGIALINILPVPLLDGGLLVFLLYEAITGRSISPRFQTYAFAIALVFLGGIMILANLIDLIDFINP